MGVLTERCKEFMLANPDIPKAKVMGALELAIEERWEHNLAYAEEALDSMLKDLKEERDAEKVRDLHR